MRDGSGKAAFITSGGHYTGFVIAQAVSVSEAVLGPSAPVN